MSDIKNREFVRTLHGMIADFLRDNPDIDRSYYQEIWDWLEKKEDEENENLKNKSGYYKAGKFWKASTLWNATKDKISQRVSNRYILQECTWDIGTLQRFANEVKNVQEVSLDYPIILDMNGNILDGAHRVVKAYLEGKDIDIVYLGDDEWPEPDYDEEKAVKESKDEKIRMKMLEHFKSKTKKTWCNIPVEDIISYLEKQKELKSGNPFSGVGFDYNGHHYGMCARDNGVEVIKDRVIIYRSVPPFIGQNPMTEETLRKKVDACMGALSKIAFALYKSECEGNNPVEQIRTIVTDTAVEIMEINEEQKEQKPINWTELNGEDIAKLEVLINNVHNEYPNGIGQESFGEEVLERFREYKEDEDLDGKEQKPIEIAPNQFDGITYGMQGHSTVKPVEWSEEEYGRLFDIEHYLSGTLQLSPDRKIACIDFIKSLRPQQKQEWSEEDEKIRHDIIARLESLLKYETQYIAKACLQKEISWFKSLSRPKPSGNWKPSKYMLSLVKKVADGEMLTGAEQMAMGTLHEQLKKL